MPATTFKKYLKHMEPYILMLKNRMETETNYVMTDLECHAYLGWAAQQAINVLTQAVAFGGDGDADRVVSELLAHSAAQSAATFKAEMTGSFPTPDSRMIRYDTPAQLQERIDAGQCVDPNCDVDHTRASDDAPSSQYVDPRSMNGYL